MNGILLQEVPSTDSEILKYVDPSGKTPEAYFKRMVQYKKPVIQISREKVLKFYPDAEL